MILIDQVVELIKLRQLSAALFSSSNRLICIFRASMWCQSLHGNPACQANSDPTPYFFINHPTSTPPPGHPPTCSERFPILLVHTILDGRLGIQESVHGVQFFRESQPSIGQFVWLGFRFCLLHCCGCQLLQSFELGVSGKILREYPQKYPLITRIQQELNGLRGSSKTKKALINRALKTSLDLRGLVFGGGGGN